MDCTVTWQQLLEIALCDALSHETRDFAIHELQRLADYLDCQIFFGERELDVLPFRVGKPTGRRGVA